MKSVRQAISTFSITLKFTDDLPNGPYVNQTSQAAADVYLSLSGQKQGRVSWTDVKTVIEVFATKVLSQQAQAMPGHVKMQAEWTVLKMEYKGGEVVFEKNLMNVKDSDMAVATFQQKITFDVKLCFCTIA